MKNKNAIGQVGEYYVAMELAKQGITSAYVGNFGIPVSADLIIRHNITLEIKTSVYGRSRTSSTHDNNIKSGGWSFTGLDATASNFTILVLLEEDYTVFKTFFIETKKLTSQSIVYRRPTEQQIAESRERRGPSKASETRLTDWVENVVHLINHIDQASKL